MYIYTSLYLSAAVAFLFPFLLLHSQQATTSSVTKPTKIDIFWSFSFFFFFFRATKQGKSSSAATTAESPLFLPCCHFFSKEDAPPRRLFCMWVLGLYIFVVPTNQLTYVSTRTYLGLNHHLSKKISFFHKKLAFFAKKKCRPVYTLSTLKNVPLDDVLLRKSSTVCGFILSY